MVEFFILLWRQKYRDQDSMHYRITNQRDVAICSDFGEIGTNRQIDRILLISGEIGIKLREYSVKELHYRVYELPLLEIFVGKILKQLVYRTFVLT